MSFPKAYGLMPLPQGQLQIGFHHREAGRARGGVLAVLLRDDGCAERSVWIGNNVDNLGQPQAPRANPPAATERVRAPVGARPTRSCPSVVHVVSNTLPQPATHPGEPPQVYQKHPFPSMRFATQLWCGEISAAIPGRTGTPRTRPCRAARRMPATERRPPAGIAIFSANTLSFRLTVGRVRRIRS